MRRSPTILIKLIKGCYLGREGQVMRIDRREGIRACEKGLARFQEPFPNTIRRPHVTFDVTKGAAHGA